MMVSPAEKVPALGASSAETDEDNIAVPIIAAVNRSTTVKIVTRDFNIRTLPFKYFVK
jgi:hypothetical protein